MDSGSGSMQSSSGGDEEYDSHQPQLIPPPPFFHNIPPSHIVSSAGSIPHLPFHLSHTFQNLPPTFYDFSSNYSLQPSLNPDVSFINNLDVVRPTAAGLRSEPTATDFKNPTTASSPRGSTHSQAPAPFLAGPSSAAQLRPSLHDNSDPKGGGLHPKVSTKKRTRASRRAPTTVLTTDTSNFRAMVQEFTGIPSPPFSAGGSSYSRRFDLFSSASSAIRSSAAHLEPSGSALYPSRPKVQLFSSCTSPPLLNNNNVMVDSAASTSYQLLPSYDHQVGQTRDPQAMSNMQQAGILSFQSLSGHDFNSKQLTQGTHLEHHIHGSTQLLSALQNDESWRSNGPAAAVAAARSNNANSINCKLNFQGSSSNLHREKEMGNVVSTRGESTVDSWICPSD